MTLIEFIKDCSSIDSSIGDLTNDILGDSNFPWEKSEKEIVQYIDIQTRNDGTNDTFQKFLAEYRKINNETLKLILNYLKMNEVRSIESAVQKRIAKPVVEICGYLITIPVENDFPQTIENDLKELKAMNKKQVQISDGSEIGCNLITSSNYTGMNITFCCQKIQLEFLLSLISKKQ